MNENHYCLKHTKELQEVIKKARPKHVRISAQGYGGPYYLLMPRSIVNGATPIKVSGSPVEEMNFLFFLL
jgi:hypothetical protein